MSPVVRCWYAKTVRNRDRFHGPRGRTSDLVVGTLLAGLHPPDAVRAGLCIRWPYFTATRVREPSLRIRPPTVITDRSPGRRRGLRRRRLDTPRRPCSKRTTAGQCAVPLDSTQAKAYQEAWARHLGVPEELTNSIGMRLRLIPPGEFLMGAPDDDADAQPAERPQHLVRLTKPFQWELPKSPLPSFENSSKTPNT